MTTTTAKDVNGKIVCQFVTELARTRRLEMTFTAAAEAKLTLMPKNIELAAVAGVNTLRFEFKRLILCDIYFNDTLVRQNVMSPQCFVGGTSSFSIDGNTELSDAHVKLTRESGQELTDDEVAQFVDDSTLVKGYQLELAVYENQACARVTVKRPSQISMYLLRDGEEWNQGETNSICFAHDTEGNCNVYSDVTIDGVWAGAERRERLGSFKFVRGVPYDLTIDMSHEVVGVMINMATHAADDPAKIARELRTYILRVPRADEKTKIIVRETYRNGVYLFEDVIKKSLDLMAQAEG